MHMTQLDPEFLFCKSSPRRGGSQRGLASGVYLQTAKKEECVGEVCRLIVAGGIHNAHTGTENTATTDAQKSGTFDAIDRCSHSSSELDTILYLSACISSDSSEYWLNTMGCCT